MALPLFHVPPGAAAQVSIIDTTFMSCTPPEWLWNLNFWNECGEHTANNEPSSAQDREMKYLFEKSAGPDFMRYAYEPAYRLARLLTSFSMRSILSLDVNSRKKAEAMLDESAVTHK